MSSNSVCNHTRDQQIRLPLRGRPILLLESLGTDVFEPWTSTGSRNLSPLTRITPFSLACEYSRLSFASATTRETRRKTSAIHRQKFHTDDVNRVTEQFCIISSTIIQCCDVQKSNSENLSCPSLKIFRLCVFLRVSHVVAEANERRLYSQATFSSKMSSCKC